MLGVAGLLAEKVDSASVSSDGIDSLESDRTDERRPVVVSLPTLISSGSSSFGGLWSTPQDRGLDVDRACLPPGVLLSLRIPFGPLWVFLRRCCGVSYLGSGSDVMASKAATGEGTDRGS